ncbi:hypothetical protein [Vannielia litorea]|uniref:hypothetical protein n=1 Tax=Vannielia litorea TaxID=1217970 RepID=UPI001BCB7B60|nr:hypothetical protein [Vannielia litorea]
MIIGYTEFSYGYALTENLVRASSTGPATAPVFPNLVQEAQLGYDVMLDFPVVPLFLQFKLPMLMVRNNAKEISSLNLHGLHPPFFRMPLMRRDKSRQHARLMELERRTPGSVFYASSTLTSVYAFNTAYLRAQVHLRSAYFSPLDIGPLPDDKYHHVSYASDRSIAWRCSEPKKVKALPYDDVVDSIQQRASERRARTFEGSLEEIRAEVEPLLPSNLRSAEDDIRARVRTRRGFAEDRPAVDERRQAASEELLVIKEMVRIGLGVEIVVAQPRK